MLFSTQKLKIYFFFWSLAFVLPIPTVCSQNSEVIDNITPKLAVEGNILPSFRFFTAIDSVLFTDKQLDPAKPILFFYFSTKCPYCQDLTKEITQQIDSLHDIQIVMVSGHRRQSIAKYAEMFSLKDFPITVLKDDEKRMHEYFDYQAVPMLRLYDKNRQLIYRQEGKLSVQNILKLFRQNIDNQ